MTNEINKEVHLDKKSTLDWSVAVSIFESVSTWVVVPIVLALIFGKMLDRHFDTKPWIFLALTGVAFIISIGGIIKVVSKYLKDLNKQIEVEKANKESKENL